MPVQAANAYPSSQMPSFPPTLEEELDSSPQSQPGPETVSHSHTVSPPSLEPTELSALHCQRDSSSTTASDSTSSSPTTSVSLAESCNNTETPVTSPDTPASSQSLSGTSFTLAGKTQSIDKVEPFRLAPAPRSLPRPATSHKKPRNLKNLAVDTSSATAFGRSVATASLPIQRPHDSNMLSAPVSPAFVKPPKQPKRSGSNLGLSIVTPSSDSPPVQQLAEVPQTPSLVKPHVLRHFPSSPALPLASPSQPPEGGMRLPPLATRRSVDVGFAEAPQEKDEEEPNFDVPQSAEAKPQSYPDGPICIYDPHVYLYYEPNAEEASQFDVVLNVASEVRNPFTGEAPAKTSPEKDSTSSSDASSPTTPKAGSGLATGHLPRPDYIHVPWDHNTDIVPDLYGLVKLIEERVQEGKRVLIHCQCGVSRSASLIVAYGLFKNPSITVQEAYDAVKRRSKWIGPNMNLIMQLQEFRSELLKQSAGMPGRGLSHRHQGSKSKITTARGTGRTGESPSRSVQDQEHKRDGSGPRSAPLPPEDSSKKGFALTTEKHAVAPGPSSAPSGIPWPTDQAPTALHMEGQQPPRNNSLPSSSLSLPPMSAAAVQDLSSPSSQASTTSSQPSQSTQPSSQASPEYSQPPPHSLPQPEPQSSRHPAPVLKPINLPLTHVSRFQAFNGGLDRSAESPRSAEFAMNPAKPPTPDDTFGLTSPRVSNFQSLHSSLHPSPSQTEQTETSAAATTSKPLQSTPQMPERQSPRPKPILPTGNLASLAGVSASAAHGPNSEHRPSLDSLTSPRSSEFAMTGIGPPRALQNDDSFGLTSPRENLSFAQQIQLPHRNAPAPPPAPPPAPSSGKREAAFSSLHSPPTSVSPARPQLSIPTARSPPSDEGARDRRKLRSKLGMSTSSSYDMRSEYILAAKARELVTQPLTRPNQGHRDSFVQATQDDLSDALMSPRATEFTRNPFADALGVGTEPPQQSSVASDEQSSTGMEKDPRSPVQKAGKGSSPIVRNIADVFS